MKITHLAFHLAFALVLGTAFAQTPSPAPAIAVEVEGAKTVALLKQLIRFDTSNPSGCTSALATFLRSQFEPLGVQIDVIAAPNGKAVHFIARLKGDGSKKPVLVAAHADVVPVERDKWRMEPFVGVEEDGSVYGRGAVDFKGGMAVFARAVMRLAEQKVTLARDVIFLAKVDEEEGQYNTTWLAKQHWHKIDAEFALNEGGYNQLTDDVKRVVGDDSVTVDFATPVSQEATRSYYRAKSTTRESSTDTVLYRAIRENAAHVWPQAQTAPVLFEAGTDAVAWRERGVPVYGICPCPLDSEILKGMHGHDERIAARSLYEGTDRVYRILLDVAKK